MAVTITRRTLAGYSGAKVNVVYVKDLVEKLSNQVKYSEYNIGKELQEKYELETNEMKFNAVVGNPPYQVNTDTNFSIPVYHLFFEVAKSLSPDYIGVPAALIVKKIQIEESDFVTQLGLYLNSHNFLGQHLGQAAVTIRSFSHSEEDLKPIRDKLQKCTFIVCV